MAERVFLGWDRPFLTRAADWLIDRRDALQGWLVIVPTSQSGRSLRDAMAERAGAWVMPEFMTPGAFLKTPDPRVASDSIERVAWMETLENIDDWSAYHELFPDPPSAGDGCAGLSREMVKLRHSLQENGLTLATAAKFLSTSVEAGRWQALGRLEGLMESTLRNWNYKSRSRVLAGGVVIPGRFTQIVLAGITEIPPLLERALSAWNGPVTALIGAPELESEHFSDLGRPLETWTDRSMPWPDGTAGSVILAADPGQQASEALRVVAEMKTPSNEVALGSADASLGGEIAKVFTRAGWPAFHPAANPLSTGLARWFRLWSAWVSDPTFATLADLLTVPETNPLVSGQRVFLAEKLQRLRNDWIIIRPDDLRQRMRTAEFRSKTQQSDAEHVLRAVESLDGWRRQFQSRDLKHTMDRLLDGMANDSEAAANIRTWLEDAADMMARTRRRPEFWIDLMLDAIPSPAPQAPDGRVIDVQGWLELFFEPGSHLVICGMNEGHVPARDAGDPWLGESAGKALGLGGNSRRAARDAFLYHAMLEARRADGRVDVICAKSGSGGEPLLPSRLLLATARENLPERVKFLFRSIEPPEAGLRWQADWKWQPRTVENPESLAVTSLATYLACPLRFYLKHVLRMQTPEPNRCEWNARDFGNIAHDVLEHWGRDVEARALSNPAALEAWFSAELDRVVAGYFGKRIPLALRLQTESLRQRFAWLARIQAKSHAEGWEVIEVEQPFEIPIQETRIIARIDRIDRHRETGALRVIDYKTGKRTAPAAAHLKKITASTTVPAHLGPESPAIFTSEDAKGKPVNFRWINLQLPLYVAAVRKREKIAPTPCYFQLGDKEMDVEIEPWHEFSEPDLDAAIDCAEWLIQQINAKLFWPPAENITYDDFAALSAGRTLEEVIQKDD